MLLSTFQDILTRFPAICSILEVPPPYFKNAHLARCDMKCPRGEVTVQIGTIEKNDAFRLVFSSVTGSILRVHRIYCDKAPSGESTLTSSPVDERVFQRLQALESIESLEQPEPHISTYADQVIAKIARRVVDRGTSSFPCEGCGQTEHGSSLLRGWYRCNECGYPGK